MDCLFCKIIAGDIPSTAVYEDDEVYAFRDIAPQAPTHILVIPKAHVANAAEALEHPGLMETVLRAAVRIAEQEGLSDKGYRLVSNTGDDARQSVRHFHVHVLGGKTLADRMS